MPDYVVAELLFVPLAITPATCRQRLCAYIDPRPRLDRLHPNSLFGYSDAGFPTLHPHPADLVNAGSSASDTLRPWVKRAGSLSLPQAHGFRVARLPRVSSTNIQGWREAPGEGRAPHSTGPIVSSSHFLMAGTLISSD